MAILFTHYINGDFIVIAIAFYWQTIPHKWRMLVIFQDQLWVTKNVIKQTIKDIKILEMASIFCLQ